MSRFVDRGATVAAFVGVGMALTVAVSFLMVIPIDPAYIIFAPLSGLLIGWYGNQRAGQLRSRPGRIFVNAAEALAEAGITDVVSFTDWYWDGQMGTARLLIGSTTLAALLGGLLYWPSAPRVKREEPVA